VSQSNEDLDLLDAVGAAASFGEAMERIIARVRNEFRSEISDLRAEIERLKGQPGSDGAEYMSINTAVVRYETSRSTVYRMLDDPDLGLSDPEIRVPPLTGPRRISVAAFEKAIRKRRSKRRQEPSETEGDE
jgi:hypothetical protein